LAEENQEARPRPGLRFAEVRDQTGRLLFRIAACGIVEIRVRGEKILVNLWEYLEIPEPK
jgi:hypothetical protein